MPLLRTFRLLLVVMLFTTVAQAAELKVVAVLPLSGMNAKLDNVARHSLEEAIRTSAGEALAPLGVTVLTGETTLKYLSDNGIDAKKVCDATCALDAAKEMKAQFFISGSVATSEGEHIAFVRFFDSEQGRQLASMQLEGKSGRDLRQQFQAKAPAFFAQALMLLKGVTAAASVAETSQSPLETLAAVVLEGEPGGPSASGLWPQWKESGALVRDEKAAKQRDEDLNQLMLLITRTKSFETKMDIQLQLAQLWAAKAQYVKGIEEMPAYEEASRNWSICREKQRNAACGPHPRPSFARSDEYRLTAMGLYEEMIKQSPQYARGDEVRFQLASLRLEVSSGEENEVLRRKYVDDALLMFHSVVNLYPHSALAAKALVAIGNEAWDRNQVVAASAAFEQVRGRGGPELHLYAEYMLAWCDSKAGNGAWATLKFQQVVAHAASGSGKAADMKAAALRDLASTYAALGQLDAAKTYFTKTVGAASAVPYLAQTSAALLGRGEHAMALEGFQMLLKDAPTDAAAPLWQAGVVVALGRSAQAAKAFEAAQQLVQLFGPESVWLKQNQWNRQAVDRAQAAVEAAKRFAGK